MNRVTNISRLSDNIKSFNAKNIEEAIRDAEQWAEENGVRLSNYYVQLYPIKGSRTIMVDVQTIGEDSHLILTH